MITAAVRYKLPAHIDYAACREHFHKIAPGFREVKGLISKHFIWSESGWAGGVYQWECIADAKAFYDGPWLDGIVERYGMNPQIELYEVFCGDRQLARQGRTLQGNCCRKIAPGGDSSIDLVLALFRVKGPYGRDWKISRHSSRLAETSFLTESDISANDDHRIKAAGEGQG